MHNNISFPATNFCTATDQTRRLQTPTAPRDGHRQPYRAYVRSHMMGPVTVLPNQLESQLYGHFCTGCVRVREILRKFNLFQSNGRYLTLSHSF